MKDLSNLVNSFKNVPAKQFTQDEVVIDEFAKNIINQVFTQLSIIFPAWKHNWKSDDPTNPDKILNLAKMEWTKAFNENGINTLEQIKFGFAKARKLESNFLPSCGVFIGWCSPSAEDLGYPSEQQALKMCVSHRAAFKIGIKTNARQWVLELCNRVDWFLMNSAGNQMEHKKAELHFKTVYLDFINSDYREPVESSDMRLETSEIVKARMSEEQLEDGRKRGSDAMAEVRRKLAKIKLNTQGNK